jgi:hypothetical protein
MEFHRASPTIIPAFAGDDGRGRCSDVSEDPRFRHSAVTVLAAICLCALQIYAYHWGVITPDTVVQYGQALSGRYDDWHPPITAWLWRQLGWFGPGGAPFLIFDSLLYWGGTALIAVLLRLRAGWPGALAMMLFAALPIGFGQVGAILKDPLLACMLLMASALILWRERSAGRIRIWLALPALALIIVASATRFNALFAAAPLIALLPPSEWVRGWRRLCLVLGASTVLLGATGWMINVTALRPHQSQPIYSLVNFDLAGIGANGGGNAYPSLTDADAAGLTARCYNPRLYGAGGGGVCARAEDSLADYGRRRHVGPIAIWLRAVTRAPLPYLKHRLAHLNWNWRFLLARIPNDAAYGMSQPNDLGLHFTRNPLTKIVGAAAYAMACSPFGRPITWLSIAVGLLVIAPQLPSRRFVTAMAASAIFYGGAYIMISVAPDLRYNLWTMIAAMIGMATAFADSRLPGVAIEKRRLRAAFAPTAIVMILESVVLAIGRVPG